jgi:hypothetical protein
MICNIAKLEKEREDLIEVITGMERWRRFSIDDRNAIALHITSHMMRLSALDDEINEAKTQSGRYALKA